MRVFYKGLFLSGCMAGLMLWAGPVYAEVALEDLLKRVEALERENAALKAEVATMKAGQSSKEVVADPVAEKTALHEPARLPTADFLKARPDVELYGFVKADLVLSRHDMNNTSTTGSSNQASITQTSASRPNLAGADDPEAQMAAQDTRLGLKFKGPDMDDGGKVTGQFEMDFAGSVGSGVYQPRLRLAFVDLAYDRWAVNAGQNWDIFAPLAPNLFNPGVLYRQGNLGTRHPQAHLANKWGDVLGGKLTTRAGLIDADDPYQEDSGYPLAAAYVGYEKDVLGVPSSFGVGGVYGRINLPGAAVGQDDVYAATAGVTFKFTDWMSMKAEGFVGAGLNKLQGGPAQTVGTTSASAASKALPVRGGFLELTCRPLKKIEMNAGYGLDDVDHDMSAIDRTSSTIVWDKNSTTYANLKYNLSKDVVVGLEIQEFRTKWMDGLKAHDQRLESSLIYKF